MAKKLRTSHNLNSQSVVNGAGVTAVPISTGISGLGSGVATFLGTPTSANLAGCVTGETGSGALVFASSPTLVTPNIGYATATFIQVIDGGTPATLVGGTVATFVSSASAGANCKVNIQSGTTGTAGLTLGDSADDDAASISFDNSTNVLSFINSGNSCTLNSSGTFAVNALQLSGLITQSYETKTASFTASKQKTYVDATAGNVTVTLPTEASMAGVELTFIRTDSSGNTVTFSRNVNGAVLTLDAQYDAATFSSNGTAYYRSA